MTTQWNAKFSGRQKDISSDSVLHYRKRRLITVFAASREEALDEVKRQAKLHGFEDATIDHMTKIG